MKHLVSVGKYAETLRMGIMERLAYRADVILEFLNFPFIFITIYFVWSIVFSNQSQVGEFTLPTLLATTLITLFIRKIGSQSALVVVLTSEIKTGKILIFLVRPVSYFWSKVMKRIAKVIFLSAIGIPCILFIQWHFTQTIPTLPAAALAFVLAFFGFLVLCQLFFLLGMTAFWIEETWGIRSAFITLSWFLSGGLIPISLFPPWLQSISFIMPFQHQAAVPALLLLGRAGTTQFLESMVVLGIWAAGLFFLNKWIWNAGPRHHDGKG
jgi:ABC-2 type transport system permease protein